MYLNINNIYLTFDRRLKIEKQFIFLKFYEVVNANNDKNCCFVNDLKETETTIQTI